MRLPRIEGLDLRSADVVAAERLSRSVASALRPGSAARTRVERGMERLLWCDWEWVEDPRDP